MSLNQAQLIGRLGKDPEIRALENGRKVASFSVATSESWKDKTSGEKKEATEWHNIVAWGPTAEVCEKYLHKGDQVFVEGKIMTRSWEKDGVKRYTTEIVVTNLIMLGSKNSSSTGSAAAPPPPSSEPVFSSSSSTDDLPF